MNIIYLPFLRCQFSIAITTIVMNEGSIYQRTSSREKNVLPSSSSPPPHPLSNLRTFPLFLHLFVPPASIHPSFIVSRSRGSFVSVRCRLRWLLSPCVAAVLYLLCRRWPDSCQSLFISLAGGWGGHWNGRVETDIQQMTQDAVTHCFESTFIHMCL